MQLELFQLEGLLQSTPHAETNSIPAVNSIKKNERFNIYPLLQRVALRRTRCLSSGH
jgi:hypothetical protein